ncbi:MAG: hypothetical protein BA865_10405 [Desulfobacterales bacterium S5133MH4]|jgi:hypothetical protein|nr:MAG: hypothetical protein BA865_10405 [Desulfobacterales bacterium S5133MH4]
MMITGRKWQRLPFIGLMAAIVCASSMGIFPLQAQAEKEDSGAIDIGTIRSTTEALCGIHW